MEPVDSASSVGDPISLVSESGNHPPAYWAYATALLILEASHLNGQRLYEAEQLQSKVAALLTGHYRYVIQREQEHLATFVDHCDTPYQIEPCASEATNDIAYIAIGSPWVDLIQSTEWRDSARLTIANHLASAIHVERLLHADRHPDNRAAAAYKARFIG